MPVTVATPAFMRDIARGWRADGCSIGLVPTMGALHAGHMSLVERARRENARVMVHRVSEKLEGAARPGHFEGVATVVVKLLSAACPDRAYFGQKDAQQVAVVKRVVSDLDLCVEVRVCPTVREEDGLALSSRNAYLSPAERRAAVCLSVALGRAAGAYTGGEHDPDRLRQILREPIEAEPLAALEYADVVDPATFSMPGSLAVLAVRIGKTRLIDNHDLKLAYPG